MEKSASVNKIVVLSAFGMFLDGYELTVIAFAVLLIPNYIHLSNYSLEYGLLIASVIIGAIIGTILVGYISDLIGRRRRLMVNLTLFFLIYPIHGMLFQTSLTA